MQIRATEAADEDAEEAFAFYVRRSTAVAANFMREFRAALKQVRERPLTGSPHAFGTRRKCFPRFPYSLIYIIDERYVTVHAVIHDRQKPEYWADRLPRS